MKIEETNVYKNFASQIIPTYCTLWGCAQTTLASFCHFLTLRCHFLPYKKKKKLTCLTTYPPLFVNIVFERPFLPSFVESAPIHVKFFASIVNCCLVEW